MLTLLLDESSQAFDRFWPHYRVPLGSWLAETFGLSGVAMARLAREYARQQDFDDQQFLRYVRDRLYRPPLLEPTGPTTLTAIADLLTTSYRNQKQRRIPAVVTFNFDDLLEKSLAARDVPFEVIFEDARRKEGKLPIIHVHGYLPSNDPIPSKDIIFTEDEYHRLSFSAFHWAQMDMINFLRNYTVLFVGLSMTDPNLRRLLDASHPAKSGTTHFVIKKKFGLSADERTKAHQTIVERARIQAQRLGVEGVEKSATLLDDALNRMLHQARDYDTKLLRDMGVETIWLEDFDQIPAFLRSIP